MKKWILFLLHQYKEKVSPSLPSSCRFIPTCSEYTMEAVDRFGVLKGSILGVWRILRCNPFGKSGLDPVPSSFFDAFRSRKE